MSYVGVGLRSIKPASIDASGSLGLFGYLEAILKSELLKRIVKIKFKNETTQHAETSMFKIMRIFFPNQLTAFQAGSGAQCTSQKASWTSRSP